MSPLQPPFGGRGPHGWKSALPQAGVCRQLSPVSRASVWARWRGRTAALAIAVCLLGVAACTGARAAPRSNPNFRLVTGWLACHVTGYRSG